MDGGQDQLALQSLVKELKSKFHKRVEEENKEFHSKDILRVTTDDKWLQRFLIHHDLEVASALTMLIDTCEWRKSNKVNEINESNVNNEYLSEGSLFLHNRDKDGKALFIFKCKKHVKGQKDFEELKRCTVYWFERIERVEKGDQITIFFDMTDTGLANMDMEYTKYLIGLCKSYYPHFLNYILIFEMPWVLNAAFKIIKTWLPTKAVQKIKFVDKKTLKDYVDNDQALKCWGGTDDYEFVFTPEPIYGNGTPRLDEGKKKVHFADGSATEYSTFTDEKGDSQMPSKIKITPSDFIQFSQEGIEMFGVLSILNTSDSIVTYKVKTTSPEKFRVRPSFGIMSPTESVTINVVLQTGYSGGSIIRDKFLIMTLPLEHNNYSTDDLNELWKNTDPKKVEQYRLKCHVPGFQSPNNGSQGLPVHHNSFSPPTSDVEQKLSQLMLSMNHQSDCISKMERDLRFIQRMAWVLMFLVLLFGLSMVYLYQPSSDVNTCDADSRPSLYHDPAEP